MGFLKRIASILGFLHGAAANDEGGDRAAGKDEAQHPAPASRRGFSAQVPVAVARPHAVPVLAPSGPGEGGVQGFKWWGERLRIDEDGDVADEFLDEVLVEEGPGLDNQRALPMFKIKYSTRPAAVRNQVIVADGSVRHSVEHQGRLQWV